MLCWKYIIDYDGLTCNLKEENYVKQQIVKFL